MTDEHQSPQPGPHAANPAQYAHYAPPPQPPYVASPPKDWMGIVALVAAFVMPVVGAVFGHLAMQANRRGEARNRGISFAGLLLSYTISAFIWLYIGLIVVWIPFVAIPMGAVALIGGIFGLVLGIRMKNGRTKTTWSPPESTWTIVSAAVVSGVALILMVISSLFIFLWTSVLDSDRYVAPVAASSSEPHVDRTRIANAAPTHTDASGGIPVGVSGVVGAEVPADAPRVDLYLDYLCPICEQFESVNSRDLDDLREQGTVQVYYHPIAILDRYSMGTDFSSRAASAAATVSEVAPERFLAFNEAMFANQPEENSAGLSDKEMVDIAISVGVTRADAEEILEGRYLGWATDATERASIDGMQGTPTVMVNGEILDQREVPFFQSGELRSYLEYRNDAQDAPATPALETAPTSR